jgi:glycosyltransferase involved in cell wall biosynthesis
MNFWETSIDYHSARKVLVIPNITNSSNIEKDSFIDVLFNHVKALKQHNDYYWYVLVPNGSPSAKLNSLDNVKQIQIPIPGDMMNQRCFPPQEIIRILKDTEYDIIYSHLPDWNVVGRYKKTSDTKIVGYCHWWEMSHCNGVDNRPGKAKELWFPNEILGVLQMEVCFVNTQDQKNKVLSEARLHFNDATIQKIDEKIKVWNLGVDKSKIIDKPKEQKENIIVFNHRTAGYKNYNKFVDYMDTYKKRRPDIKVWVPQYQSKDKKLPWFDTTKEASKQSYYEKLQLCKVGIQPLQTNYGWSVSATDCMMNGTPMLFHNSDCFREIEPDGLFFNNQKELFNLLDKIFDDDAFRKEKELSAVKRATELSDNDETMIKLLNKWLLS